MLKINLLPPQEKKELEIANFNRLLFSLFAWILLSLVIFSLLLTSSYFYLSILLEEQGKLIEVRQQDRKIQRLAELEQGIEQTNQRLDKIVNLQGKLTLWSPILEQIAQITPSEVYLTNFVYQPSVNEINVNGWASARASLLLFQKNLEQSDSFASIDAPLANLIKQSNINFSFILHLK